MDVGAAIARAGWFVAAAILGIYSTKRLHLLLHGDRVEDLADAALDAWLLRAAIAFVVLNAAWRIWRRSRGAPVATPGAWAGFFLVFAAAQPLIAGAPVSTTLTAAALSILYMPLLLRLERWIRSRRRRDRTPSAPRPTLRISRRATLVAWGIVAAIVVGEAWLVRELWGQKQNTLHENGRWTSGKLDVDMGIVGAATYMMTRRALSGNRLNLGPWHGYQELRSPEPIPFHAAGFRFTVPPDGYLIVRLDDGGATFSGVRLSRRADTPSLAFTAKETGEFESTRPITVPPLGDGEHRGTITRRDGACTVAVDDTVVAQLDLPAGPLRIGFRGGHANATVDDVVLTDPRGAILFADDFRNTADPLGRLGIALAIVAVARALAGFALHAERRRLRAPPVFYVLATTLTLGICLAIYCFADHAILSARHVRTPTESAYRRTIESGAEVQERLESTYPLAPNPRVRRVLFIGSSQTWGSGAKTEAESFVRRVERALADERVQCINTAISGADSTALLESFQRSWRQWRPDGIVVNLSNNDRDADEFAANLETLVRLAREDGARLLFVLEANALEHDLGPIETRWNAMRRVAAAHDIPVVDMHAALAPENGRGLLWWDTVHLTTFGHRLVAERLVEPVRTLVAPR